MTGNPLAGVPVLAAVLPELCPVCGGWRRVQLRITAMPPVPYGGVYRCPLCTPAGLGRPAIEALLLPLRSDTPREAAA